MSNNPFGDDLPVSGGGMSAPTHQQQQQQQPQFGASQQQRQMEHTQAQSIPGQGSMGAMGQGNPYQVPQNSYASPTQYGSPANGMNAYQNQMQNQNQYQQNAQQPQIPHQHRPSFVHDQQFINKTHAKGDVVVGALDHEHRGSLFMPTLGTQQPGPYANFTNPGQQQQQQLQLQQQPNMNTNMGMHNNNNNMGGVTGLQQQQQPLQAPNSMEQLMKSLAAMKTGRESMSTAVMPDSFDPLMEVPSAQQQIAVGPQSDDPFAPFNSNTQPQAQQQQQQQHDPFATQPSNPVSAQNSGIQYNHNPASSVNSGIQFNNQPITEDFPDPFTPSAGTPQSTPQGRDADPFAPAMAQQTKAKVDTIKENSAADTKLSRKESEPMTKDDPVSRELDDVSALTKADMDRLVRECTFHTGYRGFTLDGVHTKRSVKGKYSVKIGWRTAIKICGDSSGIVIVSHDRKNILHHFKWKDIQMVDHVHKDTLSTPLEKRSRKNFLGVKLKDGSVYVINSQFTPELKRSFMEKANVPVNNR